MTPLAEILGEVHRRFVAAPLSYGHGTDNAWDEAVALVLGLTGLPDTKSSLDAPVGEPVAVAIRELAGRRVAERLPLAYLLGKAPYCGASFAVAPGVVVPRSPIGPLLADGLRPWVAAPERILDLCCGSGCLGIVAARQFPDARVVLADIDALAVATARRNVAAHGLESRVEVVRSDLFAKLAGAVGRAGVPGRAKSVRGSAGEFDLILCNPPYVDADAMAALPDEFVHEPARGLAGGSDGLAVMNRVLGEVARHLAGDGVLVGEVGEGAARLDARWPGLPFLWLDLPGGGEGVFVLRAGDAPVPAGAAPLPAGAAVRSG